MLVRTWKENKQKILMVTFTCCSTSSMGESYRISNLYATSCPRTGRYCTGQYLLHFSLTPNNFRFMYSQKGLNQVSIPNINKVFAKQNYYNTLSGIMIFCREVELKRKRVKKQRNVKIVFGNIYSLKSYFNF
jgi:hypothetical protein